MYRGYDGFRAARGCRISLMTSAVFELHMDVHRQTLHVDSSFMIKTLADDAFFRLYFILLKRFFSCMASCSESSKLGCCIDL